MSEAVEPTTETTTHRTPLPYGLIVTAGGALLVAVGSLLPWASLSSPFGTVSVPGTRGDGQITLVLSVLIGIAAFAWWRRSGLTRVIQAAVVLMAALVVVIGWNDMSGMSEAVSETDVGLASVGAGLYLVVIGGLAALLGPFLTPRKSKT